MREAKYVIYDDGLSIVPVIFPCHVEHISMVPNGVELHSAGFLKLYVDKFKNPNVEAFGKSTSLNVGTKENSTRLLQQLLRIGEYY